MKVTKLLMTNRAAMDKNPIFFPVQKTSSDGAIHRNYWCPYYDACLDQAAYADEILCCQWCPFADCRITVFRLSMPEIEGCVRLLRAIFFDEWAYARTMDGVETDD